MKWRRYITSDGITVRTYEVPESVLNKLGFEKAKLAVQVAERKLIKQKLHLEVIRLLDQGWKTTAVAHELGLLDRQVRRISQRRNNEST